MRSSAATAGTAMRPGRNDPCPCGSGRKFKRCCGMGGRPRGARDGGMPAPAGGAAESIPVGLGKQLDIARSGEPGKIPRERAVAAEPHRQQGMRLSGAGKFAAASVALRRAVELDPRDAETHHALGRALLLGGRFAEATDSLQLATLLKDDLAAAHHDLAVALHGLGRDAEAIAACRRAVALASRSESHRLLGELLEAGGDLAAAVACFRRAASDAPEAAAGTLDLIRALLLQGELAEAEDRLRRAIAIDPDNDELYKVLGEILAKTGRFKEAIEACDHALALNPLQVPAHLTAVRVGKCTQADRPRLLRMLATLRQPGVRDTHRLFLHFAIGKLLDDLGEYREAMRHFDRANGIRGRAARFDREALANVIDRLVGRYAERFFAAAERGFATENETPLFIVGMPRSGTTLVEQIVSSHPEIAAGEELFFWFNRANSRGVAEATSLSPEAGRALAADYLAVLRRIDPTASRVTDKQTFNFQQLGLIHLLLPGARIIHCRRHPIDTCLSMYFTYFKGLIPFISDKADLAFAYRQYARIMDHWRAVLPSDRFLEIEYEALVADREKATRRLIAFTGLDWHDACLAPERNRRTVTTASLWQARQPVFATSVDRWRRYEPWIGELRQLVARSDADA